MKIQLIFLFFLLFWANLTFTQWEHIATIGNYELRAVKFFNENTGIVAGQGGLWRTTNGGVNWTQVLSGASMNGLSFFDIENGYAVGDSGKIYRTYDNGINWNQQANGLTLNNLYGVSFSTTNRINIGGANGIILRTLNGGPTWSSQGTGGPDIYSLIMNSNGDGYTFGSYNSEVVRTTGNGGTNWLTILNVNGYSCFDGTFLNNAGTVIVVGNNGRLRKTTNYGLDWSYPQSNVSSNLNAVFYLSTQECYIAGNNGTILKSTNSGENWINQTSNTSNHLKDIFFINQQTGWAVGINGLVLRTGIPLLINQQSTNITDNYLLFENYPNPFNPSTKFRFFVPEKSNIILNIYNVSGKFIETIVNKNFEAGIFEVEFNPINYPSGIYFCKLNNAFYFKTIKLIFLK